LKARTDTASPRTAKEIVLLRALLAGCMLRRLLDAQAPASAEAREALAQLVYECEQLLDDRECLVHLAVLRHIERSGGVRRPDTAHALKLPLGRLLSRLWLRLDADRPRADGMGEARA
jgi:hypothetical protein